MVYQELFETARDHAIKVDEENATLRAAKIALEVVVENREKEIAELRLKTQAGWVDGNPRTPGRYVVVDQEDNYGVVEVDRQGLIRYTTGKYNVHSMTQPSFRRSFGPIPDGGFFRSYFQ